MGRSRLLVVLITAVALAVSGCSYKTAGAPKGDLTLTATFDDAQGLVAGHSVKMSDITIGTVTKVELAGYRAKATLSIEDDVKIPKGTRAEIKVTSLLGENYVELQMPPGASMDRGPFLATGAAITDTSVQPAFEQVVGQAGPLIQALAGDDVATVVNAGATALDGNGTKLNTTIAQAGALLRMFAEQRRELGESVDRFARLGRSLAKGSDALSETPEQLERTTRLLNDDKDKIIKTVDRLTTMARELNDKVLEGRIGRFRALLRDLDPVLQQLGDNRKRLTDLVNSLVTFTEKIPRASYDGQLLLYPILRIVWPDGTPIFPGLSEPPQKKKSAGTPELPDELQGALPDLNELLEPRR
ncbi:MCE family protein [Actinomadura madurae]|uniref:MCE family protein n=1 Tax=Actinomadura madurae TaxID=1993 RepID=UPI00202670F8|nr:MlaD family protein [Actinomadura madurae]MCP9953759.1 MCE family protein [Actinomadura madurae]MCP9970513.1 MCE family protein [Actinomadura madurae]MCP9982988.1 MCE family protein [Actinomadura madurae]MCQ0005457.1 MCE family protein [Actinomadura madurae]MCQ0019228.1 MCE family protein [Actinomadura madurae]